MKNLIDATNDVINTPRSSAAAFTSIAQVSANQKITPSEINSILNKLTYLRMGSVTGNDATRAHYINMLSNIEHNNPGIFAVRYSKDLITQMQISQLQSIMNSTSIPPRCAPHAGCGADLDKQIEYDYTGCNCDIERLEPCMHISGSQKYECIKDGCNCVSYTNCRCENNCQCDSDASCTYD